MLEFSKKIFEGYPALFAFLFLCSGIIVASRTDLYSTFWISASLLPVLITLLLISSHKQRPLLWLTIITLFFLLGIQLTAKRINSHDDFEPSNQKELIHATVTKTLMRAPNFRTFIIENGINVTRGSTLPGSGRLLIRQNGLHLSAGDTIAFQSRIRKPENRGNPGEYDWETDCRNEGVFWLVSVRGEDSILVLRRGSPLRPNAILFRVRESMAIFLETYSGRFLDDESAKQVQGILKGIIVGDLGDIDAELNRYFIDSGLVHALSASGLHVAIIALLVTVIMKMVVRMAPSLLLWFPMRKIAASASIPAIIIYCSLVGARAPAIRSMIMGLVMAAAILLDKRWNSFNSLAIAGIIILLIHPLSLLTPSFQLSFVAVAGILLIVSSGMDKLYGNNSKRIHQEKDVIAGRRSSFDYLFYCLRPLTAVALTSVAATIAILPFLIQTFHSFPVYSVFANLASDFIMTGALSIGLIATMTGLIFPELGSWLLAPAAFLTLLIIKIASFFSALPGNSVRVPHLGTMEFILAGTIIFFTLGYVRSNFGKKLHVCSISCFALVGIIIILPSMSSTDDLEVCFLNVGRGDAAYIRNPGGKGILIDGGLANENFDSGRSIVVPYLQWKGNRFLEGMLISHPDMDHIGGLLSVMNRIPPSDLWWNPVDVKSSHLENIFSSAVAHKCRISPANQNCEPIKFGEAKLHFLNRAFSPSGGETSHREINNSSVICKLEYRDVSFLFTGDLEQAGENQLLSDHASLSATVLKVGHHGGMTSTTREFLEAVRPKVAIISAELTSKFPLRQEVLERIESGGAKVFITGRDGAITILTDGKDLQIQTGRGYKNKKFSAPYVEREILKSN